jgi:hypothetical protein
MGGNGRGGEKGGARQVTKWEGRGEVGRGEGEGINLILQLCVLQLRVLQLRVLLLCVLQLRGLQLRVLQLVIHPPHKYTRAACRAAPRPTICDGCGASGGYRPPGGPVRQGTYQPPLPCPVFAFASCLPVSPPAPDRLPPILRRNDVDRNDMVACGAAAGVAAAFRSAAPTCSGFSRRSLPTCSASHDLPA